MPAHYLKSVPQNELIDITAENDEADRRISVADHIRNLTPYEAVSSLNRISLNPGQTPHKLDWNEATIPPSPKVSAAIADYLQQHNHLNWYPDLTTHRLTSKLEGYVRFTKDHILVTNGSDDGLALLCQTFLNPGDEVVAPIPTYAHFMVFAQSQGAAIKEVRSSNPFTIDINQVISAISPRTKLVYLAHPNNPTGCVYSLRDLRRVCNASPQALVIIDEAYYEFYGESALPLLLQFDNLVVTRTFSKCFGLAGLRVGYIVGRPWILSELKRIFNPKTVNALGQIAAEAVLDDLEYYSNYVTEVHESKLILAKFFAKYGIPFFSTPANFVMFEVPQHKRMQTMLEAEGVYVRSRSSFDALGEILRMSVGNIAQTRALTEKFECAFKVLDIKERPSQVYLNTLP